MIKPYYQDEWVTIYHGDCREILPQLPKVDLVLTDPPYGIGVTKMQLGNGNDQVFYRGNWDNSPPDQVTINMLLSAGCNQIIFGGNYFSLPISRGWIVWDKNNGASTFADGELIWTSYNIPLRIKKVHWVGSAPKWEDTKGKLHPTQKPIKLVEYLIGIKPTSTIIDPFMGSGTTAVASRNLSCHCIGIEIEEKYCEVAVKRCTHGG